MGQAFLAAMFSTRRIFQMVCCRPRPHDLLLVKARRCPRPEWAVAHQGLEGHSLQVSLVRLYLLPLERLKPALRRCARLYCLRSCILKWFRRLINQFDGVLVHGGSDFRLGSQLYRRGLRVRYLELGGRLERGRCQYVGVQAAVPEQNLSL